MSTKFNILELTDLALSVPEKGAVNFNILHTVITTIIVEAGLGHLKPPCHIKDETLAQAAITKARMRGSPGKREGQLRGDIEGKLKAMRRREGSKLKQKSKETEGEQKSEYTKGEQKSEDTKDEQKSEDTKGEQKSEDTKDEQESDDPKSEPSEEIHEESDRERQQSTEAKDKPEEIEPPKDEEKGTEKATEEGEEEKQKTTPDQDSKPTEEERQEDDAETKTREKLSDIQKKSLTERDDETKILTSDQVEDMQETARDILEQSADALSQKTVVVTDALKILTDEDLLEGEPAKVMEEVWRATNVNRRLDAAEEGLLNLSDIIDEMYNRVVGIEDESKDVISKTEKLFDEIMKYVKRMNDLDEMCMRLRETIDIVSDENKKEINRLEDIIARLQAQINELEESTQQAVKELETKYNELAADVAFKTDLEKLRSDMNDTIESEVSGLKNLINAVREECVPKIDFAELESRVETLEDTKVNREELGRLLEPGFVDNFLAEQESLRTDVDGLKKKVSFLEEDFDTLKRRIDEEIVKTMEEHFDEIGQMLEVMNAKLATLDADEINESFANLEDQAGLLIKELEDIKNSHDLFKKEAKLNFNKISNVNALLDKLEQTKVDKSKLYEMLELKADVDMIKNKLDRSEFRAVMQDMEENLERLTITVKINEEELNESVRNLRYDLSLKMYTEDFVTATEPIRNRIKAIMYETKKVKEIALTQLFPDAPGVVKCFGCKRAANLVTYNYQGSGDDEDDQNVYQTTSQRTRSRFPPIDIDNIPIPPPSKKREVPAEQLPMLIAHARPHVGLPYEKRKSQIDKEVRAYFATRKIRPVGGEYTRTLPQQKGLQFTTEALKSEKVVPEIRSLREPKGKKGFIKPILKKSQPPRSRSSLVPSSVGLHVNKEPMGTTSYVVEAEGNEAVAVTTDQSDVDSDSSDDKNQDEEKEQ